MNYNSFVNICTVIQSFLDVLPLQKLFLLIIVIHNLIADCLFFDFCYVSTCQKKSYVPRKLITNHEHFFFFSQSIM